ncbi:hypothetical protein D1007_00110 [Hordeum vulgare]|nr:hypothetical protein D1007_00110 [Hordeum vulgare]
MLPASDQEPRAPPPSPSPPPAMTREWGDAAVRAKSRAYADDRRAYADDRRAPPHPSPDGLWREDDLREKLVSRQARRSPTRDARRSPPLRALLARAR